MSDELKPCPFCGSPASYKTDPHEGYKYSIQCSSENCPNEDRDFQGYCFISADEWNTRPIEDALTAALESANKQNADLQEKLDVAREALDYYARNDGGWTITKVGKDALACLDSVTTSAESDGQPGLHDSRDKQSESEVRNE